MKSIPSVVCLTIGFVAGLFAAIAFGSGMQQQNTTTPMVNSQRYEMTDANGRLRGEWFVDKDAKATFALRSPTGESAVTMTADAVDSAITLADPKGNPRCVLSATTAGTSTVRLLDSGNQVRIEMACQADKGAHLRLLDKAGKVRFTVSQADEDQSVLQLWDADGKVVWSALETSKPEDSKPAPSNIPSKP